MNIRYAKENDSCKLDQLFSKLLNYERDNYDINIKQSLNITGFFIKRINKIDNIILLAEEENEIIGYIYGYIRSNNKIKIEIESYIESIFIEDRYRNKGIGRKLIETFINESKKRNVKYIIIENKYLNTIAKKLYSDMGFNIFIESRRKELWKY